VSKVFSTDQIRNLYGMAVKWKRHDYQEKQEAEFDSWLALHDAEVIDNLIKKVDEHLYMAKEFLGPEYNEAVGWLRKTVKDSGNEYTNR
jgi:hypothetical protein